MSLPKHLAAASERLAEAAFRIEAARTQPSTPANLRDWLIALTDHGQALSDIQRLNNESIHEKLHAIAGRLGVERAL